MDLGTIQCLGFKGYDARNDGCGILTVVCGPSGFGSSASCA